MELISTPREHTPQERLSLYRLRSVPHAILLLPFESLSRLQQEASQMLAAEWGRELAELPSARVDLMHVSDEERTSQLAGLWLLRLLDGPVFPPDAQEWVEEAERWRDGRGSDPRLAAFMSAWREAAQAASSIPAAGPRCRCASCKEKYSGHRRNRR